jgi:hypothetical protein
MEDLTKLVHELFPPEGAAVKNTTDATETPSSILLESILPRLPPEGQAWLNGLNPFCRRAVEHDLRFAGPDLFVQYWESLRDTLQNSNATSVHPIIGSSLPRQRLSPAPASLGSKLLSKDEARRIAANIAKLPVLLR